MRADLDRDSGDGRAGVWGFRDCTWAFWVSFCLELFRGAASVAAWELLRILVVSAILIIESFVWMELVFL